MKSALHGGLIVALLISFSQAPHDHFHPGDSEHQHDHHLPSLGAQRHADELETALDAPDHDSTAKLKDWLAGDGSAPSKHHAEAVAPVAAAELTALRRTVAVESLRNHDPPALLALPARAPPVYSCL